jgi:pyruvate ferredoxin oxidoreductase alpha subunit
LFEHKFQQAKAMRDAKKVIREVQEEFYQLTGRKYDLIEEYRMEDAEYAIVLLNSTAGTAKEAVDKLREQGIKAGLVKPRVYRPFPGEEIANALRKTKAVAILDKADGLNAVGGPLFTDTTSAMLVNNATAPIALSYIYGIGGRDVKIEDIESVFNDLQNADSMDNPYRYLGLKGGRD